MNLVEFLFERSRGRDGDLIAGVKETLTFRELREKVERLSRWTAWQYCSGKKILVLFGDSGSLVPDISMNPSNKIDRVRIREMLSRGETPAR